MFSYGPFSHTGLKVDIATESGFSIMAGILNPTDITEFNPTGDYFFGAQLGYGGFYLNGLFGDGYTQFDLTGGIDISDNFYLGINATTTDAGGDAGFTGVAGYAQFATSDNFKIGLRYEFFDDSDGSIVYGAQDANGNPLGYNVSDFTITAQYTVGGLTIIPEFRIDSSSEDLFNDGSDDGSSLSSFVLAFVYGF